VKRCIATFGFLIALGANLALAQASVDPPAGKPENKPQTPEADPVQGAPDSAPPARPGDATAATTEPAPAGSDDSPFDYQASEQISEDLSVSFPVDI
jgi:hypothetical protein